MPENDLFSGFHESAPPLKKTPFFLAKMGTRMVCALVGSGGGRGDRLGGWG